MKYCVTQRDCRQTSLSPFKVRDLGTRLLFISRLLSSEKSRRSFIIWNIQGAPPSTSPDTLYTDAHAQLDMPPPTPPSWGPLWGTQVGFCLLSVHNQTKPFFCVLVPARVQLDPDPPTPPPASPPASGGTGKERSRAVSASQLFRLGPSEEADPSIFNANNYFHILDLSSNILADPGSDQTAAASAPHQPAWL